MNIILTIIYTVPSLVVTILLSMALERTNRTSDTEKKTLEDDSESSDAVPCFSLKYFFRLINFSYDHKLDRSVWADRSVASVIVNQIKCIYRQHCKRAVSTRALRRHKKQILSNRYPTRSPVGGPRRSHLFFYHGRTSQKNNQALEPVDGNGFAVCMPNMGKVS